MRVVFLGTGTSHGVPAIACRCAVCRSEDAKDKRLRTSVLIEVNGKTIVIDTGPDFRAQMLREEVMKLDAVIFTHEHKDHTAGLDDIRAFNFGGHELPVYAEPRVQENIRQSFSYIFQNVAYPGIPKVALNAIGENRFYIGDVEVIPIRAYHLNLPVLGFRIGSFSYITDANRIAPEELAKVEGSEALVLNALRRTSHISHFSLEEAIAVARKAHVPQAYFVHMSHDMGKHADVEAELPPGINLAWDGLTLDLP